MYYLVVLCHPDPASFNRAIADGVVTTLSAAGATASLLDLYRETFDPVLPLEEMKRRFSFDEAVRASSERLTSAAGIVVVHPDWWGGPPALLKGWIDRVFRPGVAYDFEGPEFMHKERVPLMTGKKALVFCTSDVEADEPEGKNRVTSLTGLWRDSVFGYCGVTSTIVRVFAGMHSATQRRRRDWLDEVSRTTADWAARGQDEGTTAV